MWGRYFVIQSYARLVKLHFQKMEVVIKWCVQTVASIFTIDVARLSTVMNVSGPLLFYCFFFFFILLPPSHILTGLVVIIIVEGRELVNFSLNKKLITGRNKWTRDNSWKGKSLLIKVICALNVVKWMSRWVTVLLCFSDYNLFTMGEQKNHTITEITKTITLN